MSTRKTLLIVAHGQPSEPAPPEAHMEGLAAKVAQHLPGWQVAGTTIAMPGALEAKADALGPGALVYPFFMADGWFTTKVLPDRLGPRDVRMLAPLGHEPDLPGMVAHWLGDEAKTRGWSSADVQLLLAAHGSARGMRAAQAAYRFAAALALHLPLGRIVPGFVEQGPRLATAARGLGSRAFCLPFFAVAGGHVRDDIPEALAQAGFGGVSLPVLGDHPEVAALIAASASKAARPPD